MAIYDVSMTIREGMKVYKDKEEKQPQITTSTNGHVTESRIDMDLHTGTHVDSPLHMINDGETMETIAVEDLVGTVKVFDLSDCGDSIDKSDVELLDINKGDFILFKTKNSYHEGNDFDFDFTYVTGEAAELLAEKGIKGVGVDGLGIERSQPDHPTHRTLFTHRIIIIEGLRLKEISEGSYFMMAAPLKIEGTDASPARILLMDE
ncbi:cyclase family protein [Salimicrobium salexigens]|uniref:Kynurenine formamidase n=1 Tax=Salimicrobium salexigens TaxID=908941 RepID=A0ABY1KKN0_9BACI|nr:cyclase family protein [Salimicrobium salexigens]SIS45995.1 Kynurenine formamidase [Salimicrobium salexigens]